MLTLDKAGAPKTKSSSEITVMNQGEEELRFLNGVKFRHDLNGKPIFEDA